MSSSGADESVNRVELADQPSERRPVLDAAADSQNSGAEPHPSPLYTCVTNPHCLGLHASKHLTCTAGDELLSEVVHELRMYIDFQQKLDYREYAASTQKVLDRFEAAIAAGEV